MKDIILGIIRHVATFGGGAGVTAGVTTNDEVTTGVSALVTLIGIVWSIVEKVNAKKK